MKTFSGLKADLRKAIDRRLHGLWYPGELPVTPGSNGTAFTEAPPAFLRAASMLYEKGLQKDQAKLRKKRVKLPVPVISIGNLSLGGTGKTPLTIWMCEFLLKTGLRPAVLIRGYGRRGRSLGRLPFSGDTGELSDIFGDEPVMISTYLPDAPVWVGSDRAASGRAALAECGVDVLVLDDGFQHLALERDLDVVLLDCRSPFGNGFVLPAGPLREPPSNLKRADAFVITHADRDMEWERLKCKLESLFPGVPVFACRHKVKGVTLKTGGRIFDLEAFLDRRALVFAGIANPEGFFTDLRGAGMKICKTFGFPDHHRYEPTDFSMIFRAASEHDAEVIITTAKDFARIPIPYKDAFAVAEIGIDFGDDRGGFCGLTKRKIDETAGTKMRLSL